MRLHRFLLFITFSVFLFSCSEDNDITTPRNLKEYIEANSNREIDNVIAVSDLHIWNLSSGYIALTAHVKINSLNNWPDILLQARRSLNGEFGIQHITIQPEL